MTPLIGGAVAIFVAVNENGRRIGGSHHRSTISDETVDLIRTMHEDRGKSYGQIHIKTKIAICTIRKICRYERRAQIPDRWKRV